MKYGLHIVVSPAAAIVVDDGERSQQTADSGERGTTMNTVLITGCSSGYGLETARHFHAQGWNVIATMRTPRGDLLPRSERMRVLPLDVTRPESIAAAIDAAGSIDVLVNNAGIGVIGVFEVTPMATVREIFETNTFGVMAMTQAVLPRFRARRSGVVVNVTSSVTLAPMPLAAAYTASKMAIEGFTGSLAHELAAFNVRVKLVEPGYGPTTRFTSNVGSRMEGLFPDAYAAFAKPVLASFAKGDDGNDGVRRRRGGVPRRERRVRAAPLPRRRRRRGPDPVGVIGESGVRCAREGLLDQVGQGGEELGAAGAVERPVVARERQHQHRLAVVTGTTRSAMRPTARIAACGGFTIAVKPSTPYIPRLLMVKPPPAMPAGRSFAAWARPTRRRARPPARPGRAGPRGGSRGRPARRRWPRPGRC
jgi:NAD(P)-dependent dehydrogenase (short-subunit alcohol dehydrogenase family)